MAGSSAEGPAPALQDWMPLQICPQALLRLHSLAHSCLETVLQPVQRLEKQIQKFSSVRMICPQGALSEQCQQGCFPPSLAVCCEPLLMTELP